MTNDSLATVSPSNVDTLIEEYHAAISDRPDVTEVDNVRFAVWDYQSTDGRKHDREGRAAFPFDGASDTRIRMADQIVNDNVDLIVAGFDRSQVSTQGIEARDAQVAGAASKALEWARNGGIPELDDEVEYAAQWGQAYGWCVLHTTWQRRLANRREKVTFAQLQMLARQMPVVARLLGLIIDPSVEDLAVAVLQEAYPDLVRLQSSTISPDEIPAISESQARKIVVGLRQGEEVEVVIPYVSANHPQITALRPFEDVWFPADTADLQRARCIFRVDWMSESELLAAVTSMGWKEKWVDEVIKTRGAVSQGLDQTDLGLESRIINGKLETKENLSEVVWAYHRAVDSDGVEEVRYTVFSPHVSSDVGKAAITGPLDYSHGEYPFAVYRRERHSRRITSSRGVPEIVCTWQIEKKSQRDALLDRTSLSISPPLKVPLRNMGRTYRLGPMKQIAVSNPKELEWMEPPPGNPAEAIELIREIGMDANDYFGRISEGVDPVHANIKQQRMVNSALGSWLKVFHQVLSLMQQFLSDTEWEEITGSAAPDRNFERIQRKPNWRLHFDVRDLNSDFMAEKLKAFAQMILPMDAAGVIDRSKLAMVAATWIDPSIARVVVADKAGASKKLFTQVQTDWALMALGNEPAPVENDPTATTQIDYAKQILKKNPKYQAQLQNDQDFAQLADKWMQNRQHSVDQERNKVIGRIGVDPE